MRFGRNRSAHPPREGWVVLLDAAGQEVSERRPVVVDCDPLRFVVEHDLSFSKIAAPAISFVRVIDADGKATDVPLTSPSGP